MRYRSSDCMSPADLAEAAYYADLMDDYDPRDWAESLPVPWPPGPDDDGHWTEEFGHDVEEDEPEKPGANP